MKFESYIPSDILKPFVKSFAIQETSDERAYKVLPDTGLVIGFQYKGKLSYFQGQIETPLSVSGISGLSDQYRTFKSSAGTGTVLVFFKEGSASIFFRQPLHELFRESLSLDNFMLRSELLLLEEQLSEAKSNLSRIKTIEEFLIMQMVQREPDKLVLAALSLIHESKGKIRIKELADRLYISQSPLEKRFRQAVGASPKKFSSLVRFKNAIKQYDPDNSLTSLGQDAGFYDQAHFIKEFKTFTGDTPDKFFASEK